MSPQKSYVAVGGVFRNQVGDWLLGFAMTVGKSGVFQTEAVGFKRVEAESDNVMMIDTICNCYAADNNLLKVRFIHFLLVKVGKLDPDILKKKTKTK